MSSNLFSPSDRQNAGIVHLGIVLNSFHPDYSEEEISEREKTGVREVVVLVTWCHRRQEIGLIYFPPLNRQKNTYQGILPGETELECKKDRQRAGDKNKFNKNTK